MTCDEYRKKGKDNIVKTGVTREDMLMMLNHFHDCPNCQEWTSRMVQETPCSEDEHEFRRQAAIAIIDKAMVDSELRDVLDRIKRDV
jgi:hypothetical protein